MPDLSITEAVRRGIAPFTHPASTDVAARLVVWARRVCMAGLDELAAELFEVWEATRPSVRQLKHRTVRRPRPRPLDEPTRRAVRARLGLDASAPATIAQAAELSGVSPDRIRMVTAGIRRVTRAWMWAPTLDQALALADGTLTADEYTATLLRLGLTRRSWHPQAVASLARLCGRQPSMRFTDQPMTKAHADTIRRIATAQVQARALTTIDAIAAAAASPPQVAREVITRVLQEGGKHVVAGQIVGVADPVANGGRLAQVTWRLLALAERHRVVVVTVAAIHRGIARRLRQRQQSDPPDIAAVYAYLCAHPDVVVHERDTPGSAIVRARHRPPRVEELYAGTARLLVDVIGSSPDLRASRQTLVAQAIRTNVKPQSVKQALTYHEAFARYTAGVWTFIGLAHHI